MPQSAASVTGNFPADLPAVLDAITRKSRAAGDDFILRDAPSIAVFAGMSAQSVCRQREHVEGVIPALAKVSRNADVHDRTPSRA